jgi:hypothetical protein
MHIFKMQSCTLHTWGIFHSFFFLSSLQKECRRHIITELVKIKHWRSLEKYKATRLGNLKNIQTMARLVKEKRVK